MSPLYRRRLAGVAALRRARAASPCSRSGGRPTRSRSATPTTRCSTPRRGSARSTATCASPASRSARSARSSGEGDDVRVALVLDEDVTLHRDATAAMRPHTLFEGSNFVDLSPGSPSAPADRRGRDDPAARRRATTSRSTRRCACCGRTSGANLRTLARGRLATRCATRRSTACSRRCAAHPALMRDLAPAARAAQGTQRRRAGGRGPRAVADRRRAPEPGAATSAPLVTPDGPDRRGADGRRRRAARRDAGRAARRTLRELRTSAPAAHRRRAAQRSAWRAG